MFPLSPLSAPPVSLPSFGMGFRLQRGASGPAVKELQAFLKKLGLYHGKLGGNFGPLTDAALRTFQKMKGLKADGWAGPITMGVIKAMGGGAMKSPPSGGFPSASTFSPAQQPVAQTQGPSVSMSGPRAEKIASMLEWSKSKLGSPYAAVNPFRFGDVPWDGRTHQSVNGSGSSYTYPKGTTVFDCSGFVVASFRKLGIDLNAKGLSSSWSIHANSNGFLQNVSKDQLQPGDLITYTPKNGVGHVVIYMGNGMMIQSSGGKGVNIAPVDWSRFQSARRVPVA